MKERAGRHAAHLPAIYLYKTVDLPTRCRSVNTAAPAPLRWQQRVRLCRDESRVSWSAGCDIGDLTGIVFSRLSSLGIDGAAEQDGVIVVRARTASWSGRSRGAVPSRPMSSWNSAA